MARFFIIIFVACLSVFFVSCACPSAREYELRRVLNTKINLQFIFKNSDNRDCHTIYNLKHNSGFTSIVYLQNGCAPCFPKFMEWQEQIASMELPADYTVLFVIQGERYSQFIEEVNEYARKNLGVDTVENNFPVAMDPDFDFLSSNHTIPRWIIDRSVLIDSQNRIRMVGAPWATPEMTELFQRICSEGKND